MNKNKLDKSVLVVYVITGFVSVSYLLHLILLWRNPHRGLNKETTYGIGDMASDCYAAKCAGIKTIGVLWGTGTKNELADVDYLCSTVSELKVLLGMLCRK